MSKQDMIAAGETLKSSAQLKSGGYVAVTGAYHELHCLVCVDFSSNPLKVAI